MSWSGFKKNVGRATTQVMMKTGHVEKTSDRPYEVEERRYRTLESASLRLQKEAKGYLDSLRAMTASQMRIAETIDAFYGDSGAQDGVSRSYKQAVEDLDAETVKALDGPYRCVSRVQNDPEIQKSSIFNEATGTYDWSVVEAIEAELNWKSKRRHFTREMVQDAQESMELIEYVYRTTVLEPINRFCAYFPDINECIKKRNHKLLDYDSMRAKVKKLVEKPDKDPSKLPRAEKETEMVNPTFLHSTNPSVRPPTAAKEDSLLFPSPPKALEEMKHDQDEVRQARIQAEEDAVLRGIGAKRDKTSTSIKKRINRMASTFFALHDDPPRSSAQRQLVPSPNPDVRSKKVKDNMIVRGGGMIPSPIIGSSPQSGSQKSDPDGPPSRSVSVPFSDASSDKTAILHREDTPSKRPFQPSRPASSNSRDSLESETTTFHQKDKESVDSDYTQPSDFKSPAHRARTPFFNPSELEEIMAPLKAEKAEKRSKDKNTARTSFFHPSELEEIMGPLKAKFAEERTNEMLQAKAAYDQLNEQLTSELPQLIDLRVPYLDPSFEALVKIQLRFCAEAYSRMAQVQQYLDASTRDQYANGDLDARVEDVLGQIRELSIAGTV